MNHGNEETFRDMLRVKRTVQTAFSQVGTDGRTEWVWSTDSTRFMSWLPSFPPDPTNPQPNRFAKIHI